jgi:hypothetical protein
MPDRAITVLTLKAGTELHDDTRCAGALGDPDRPDAQIGSGITLPSALPQDLVAESAAQ